MDLSDILIIYLACGAPFGVHFALSQRNDSFVTLILAATAAILWLPYSAKVFHGYVSGRLTKSGFLKTGKEFDPIMMSILRRIETLGIRNNSAVELFALREAMERYTGLTGLIAEADIDLSKADPGIFQLGVCEYSELALICRHRRNQAKLRIHRIDARDELFAIFSGLASLCDEPDLLIPALKELFEAAKDKDGIRFAEELNEAVVDPASNDSIRGGSNWRPQQKIKPLTELAPLNVNRLTIGSPTSSKD